MAVSRAASRYVKALLDLAVEKKALEDVHRDMLLFSQAVSDSRQLELLLKNPVIKHEQKFEILKKIFDKKVHVLTMAFFEIITRKNREPILLSVAREFHNAYNEFKGIGTARVTSAIPVDAAVRAQTRSCQSSSTSSMVAGITAAKASVPSAVGWGRSARRVV